MNKDEEKFFKRFEEAANHALSYISAYCNAMREQEATFAKIIKERENEK